MLITSTKASAEWFNEKIPDACRKITSDDVCLMIECKLIGMYRFYGCQDMETVRAVLQYEQLRGHRPIKQDKKRSLHAANPVGNNYLQTQKLNSDDPRNTVIIANPQGQNCGIGNGERKNRT
jgi:hypothetical protein